MPSVVDGISPSGYSRAVLKLQEIMLVPAILPNNSTVNEFVTAAVLGVNGDEAGNVVLTTSVIDRDRVAYTFKLKDATVVRSLADVFTSGPTTELRLLGSRLDAEVDSTLKTARVRRKFYE